MTLAPLMADEAQPAAPSAPASATPPPAATDGATPPPEAISTENAIAQIDGEENMDALAAMLDAANNPKPPTTPEPNSTAAPTPPPAAPAATPPASGASAPAPVVTAPGTPAAEPGEDEVIEGTGEEKLPRNFRFHTENPQRSRYLKLLRQQPEANPIELARQAGYTLPAEAAAATPAAPAQPAEDPLKAQRDEIAALTAQRKAARDAYEFGTADELSETILEKRLALERKEMELEAETQFQQEYQGEYVEARAQAIAKYPETAVKGTPQAEEVARERAYLEQTEPGFFDNPEYPLALLERLEKRRPDLFKAAAPAPASTTPAAPPPTPPAVTPPPNAAPKNAARPVGAVEPGASGAAPPLTKEAAVKAIDEMSAEELEKLGDAVGTKNIRAGTKTPGVIRG